MGSTIGVGKIKEKKKRIVGGECKATKKSSNEHGMIIAQKQASKRKNIGTPQTGTFKPIPQMTAEAHQKEGRNTDKPDKKQQSSASLRAPSPGRNPNPQKLTSTGPLEPSPTGAPVPVEWRASERLLLPIPWLHPVRRVPLESALMAG
jgi:hypothetical protein